MIRQANVVQRLNEPCDCGRARRLYTIW